MSLKIDALSNPILNDPETREDPLPFPYSIINEVLQETIMYQLNLKMYEIEQKKKNENYEGVVGEYICSNFFDIEGISCLSVGQKTNNHLLAGDKSGNVYLLDLAKRAIFSKKELTPAKKIIHISDTIITDGETSITIAAIISHSHNTISIMRYKYSEPKLFLTEEITVCENTNDPNLLPYTCEIFDYGRLVVVKCYGGNIKLFRLAEMKLDYEQINGRQGGIAVEEEVVKKMLKYPLNIVNLDLECKKVKETVLDIEFKGNKSLPKYNDVKAKLLGIKKNLPPPEEPTKKDPKKKEDKKVDIPVPEKTQPLLSFNEKIVAVPLKQTNGVDLSEDYPLPYYEPFFYIFEEEFTMPKSKYFEKAKSVPLLNFIIYGWKNGKEFNFATLEKSNLGHVPEFLQVAYNQEALKEGKVNLLKEYNTKKIKLVTENIFKNVHDITSSTLSLPDKSLLAFGLKDGTISVWNPLSQNLEFNTDKHLGAVTGLAFFEKWKLVSGDENNEIFIHNVVNRSTEVKRTNIFEPKQKIPIQSIQINELGIAFCLDSESNLRIYDLWRNEKIAKVHSCSAYSLMENKGKKWLPSKFLNSIYSNRDFTVILSVNWPSFASRIEDRTPEEIEREKEITKNPWIIPGTNTHVVRNFDLLLNLFEGLENVYRKGYERKKVENLFSNLEFSQLRDRTFEIPDFGKAEGEKLKKNHSINKSLFSNNRQSQSSFATSKSKEKELNGSRTSQAKNSTISKAEGQKAVRLTHEVLHPEKFLLERRKIQKDLMITCEGLVDLLREEHAKKELRENKLGSETGKSVF